MSKTMPHVTNAQFRGWLKSAVNMKLSSYASVLRITYEGLKKFDSFTDFDRESIESLGKAYSKTIDDIIADPPNGIQAENEVPQTNISTIYIRRLVVATHAINYHCSIGRVPGYYNMNYVNVLSAFNADHDAYSLIWKQYSPDTPFVVIRTRKIRSSNGYQSSKMHYHAPLRVKDLRFMLFMRAQFLQT